MSTQDTLTWVLWDREQREREAQPRPTPADQLQLPFEVGPGRRSDCFAIPSLTPGTESYARWARARLHVLGGAE